MKGYIVFAVLALVLGANAYEGIEPASEPLVYTALFDGSNLQQRIQDLNPNVVDGDEACMKVYVTQEVTLLQAYNAGVRQCFHLTAEEFQSVFTAKVYNHMTQKVKTQLTQCAQNSETKEEKLECFGEALIAYVTDVHKLSKPYIQVSKSCLHFVFNRLERQWDRAFTQLEQCFAQVKADNQPMPEPMPPMSSMQEKVNNLKNH